MNDIKLIIKNINISEIQDMKAEVPYIPDMILPSKSIFNDQDNDLSSIGKKSQNHIKTLTTSKKDDRKVNNDSAFTYRKNKYFDFKGIDYEESWFVDMILRKLNYKYKLESSSVIKNEVNLLDGF